MEFPPQLPHPMESEKGMPLLKKPPFAKQCA